MGLDLPPRHPLTAEGFQAGGCWPAASGILTLGICGPTFP
jgi:hypothetical protein